MEIIFVGIISFLMGGISFSYYMRRTMHYMHCHWEHKKYANGEKEERRRDGRRYRN